MATPLHAKSAATPLRPLLQDIGGLLLASLPLALIQPILDRIARNVARSRPEVFARLGSQAGKRFLIDPTDLPFVLVLVPDPQRPTLRAYRRHERPAHDAAIAGTFFHLLDMIDGELDGDALFFSRDLQVNGDTEAVVTLRNALDDIEGGALQSVLSSLGPLSTPTGFALSKLRPKRGEVGHG
jgi:predicted lipid carrier protein YhbT